MINLRCTYCEEDLTVPANELGFRLYLVEQTKYNKPGCATSPLQYPDQYYYFCDYVCLWEWVERKGEL